MANQAEKKSAKKSENVSGIFLQIIMALMASYILYRIIWKWHEFGIWNWLGFVLLAIVHYVTYSGIASSLELGVDYEYYLDVFVINAAVNFLTLFSDWFWLIYLVVPGFIGWKLVKIFLNWIFTPDPEPDNDPRNDKKRLKQERQAARGQRFQTVRR
eukprot:GILK01007721.1.p1 GENE.GILK01007721.1~~GILK01007721.1.p1  ORF type:complete len:157 (-),score=23.24 GILK01007721.1:71-541(-)